MSLHDELVETIASWHLPAEVGDDTSLIRSGLLDSLALFNLVLWVEERTGRGLDPTRVNIRRELDTVRSILEFVGRASQDANAS